MLKIYPNNKSPLLSNPQTIKLFDAFGGSSDNVRLIGGCVRDLLLNKENFSDIDVATSFTPDQVMSLLDRNKIKTIATGLKHGTITAIIDNSSFEITTLRRDISCDGRHAEVEYSNDWQEDAARRDFTINAMSLDLDGNIYDYFGGMDDLNNRTIRFVGNAKNRVKEDFLRILRYFRFSAHYSNEVFDEEAITACKEGAKDIDLLSGERISQEMLKLLGAKDPHPALDKMQQYQILPHIFSNIEINLDILKQVISNENILSENIKPRRRLLALLYHANSDQLAIFAKRWKISSDLYHYLKDILYIDKKTLHKQLIIDLGKDKTIDYLILNSSQAINDIYNFIKNWDIPIFPLKGEDLIKINIEPGKKMGQLLDVAKKHWQDTDYTTNKQELIEFIQKLL
ncbi:CCA-adding enzyme [Candidatus Arcanobacter lacustris]|uniref:CCA-adding enzyme n=1 Tax=Candidatus Arcanibacter lacustris TaxID=1607817 RepID=A0A0F5MQ52_9RICK|nr:CCA-adding enzyme [Candidatus Arcanobacter lacustris]